MTVSFKARVPKVTEDDILLNIPLPIKPEDITWVWRRKGLRAQDIMNIEMVDKNISVITYWDYFIDEPKKYVVKESFDELMLKWELAEVTNVVFDDEEGDAPKGNDGDGDNEEDD